MDVVATAIPEIRIITTPVFRDRRGYFTETWNRREFAASVGDRDFVEDRLFVSRPAGTLRGLHFQAPPAAQDKLVRCLRGSALNIVLDIRHGAPGRGRHVAAELSAENRRQLLIPAGFAHGFLTLAPNTEMLIKVTSRFDPGHATGVRWNDPALGIDWPVPAGLPLVTEADNALPYLAELPSLFPIENA